MIDVIRAGTASFDQVSFIGQIKCQNHSNKVSVTIIAKGDTGQDKTRRVTADETMLGVKDVFDSICEASFDAKRKGFIFKHHRCWSHANDK